jgi:hypothetical protein
MTKSLVVFFSGTLNLGLGVPSFWQILFIFVFHQLCRKNVFLLSFLNHIQFKNHEAISVFLGKSSIWSMPPNWGDLGDFYWRSKDVFYLCLFSDAWVTNYCVFSNGILDERKKIFKRRDKRT